MEPRKIKCPICSKETLWSESNPYRPFCSQRCRTIDLGDWLSEKHVIPGSKDDDSSQKEPEK
jgi:uncharacterized protein